MFVSVVVAVTREVPTRGKGEAEANAAAERAATGAWAEGTPPPSTTAALRRPLDQVASDIVLPVRSRGSLVLKRTIDIAGSGLALLLLSPVFLLLAVMVKLTSHGPALFVQNRVGKGGRVFKFYKFRSMVCDAENRRFELEHLNEMSGPVFKISRDPRITRVGGWLRKSSLDELPQFWNVLKGDMSLVGPRPPLPDEVQHYTKRQAQRLGVVPGLTGLWQVSGRSNIANFDTWVELDLSYVERWSIWLDLKILAKTPAAVLFGGGAH